MRAAHPEDRNAILDLVAVTAAADPDWLRTVDAASASALGDWFDTKRPGRAWVATTSDGTVIGFIGVRDGRDALVQRALEHAGGDRRASWSELCRLFVHPEHRRSGVGAALADTARADASARGRRTWLTCVAGSTAELFWTARGWVVAAPVRFPAHVDDRPGVCCTDTTPAQNGP